MTVRRRSASCKFCDATKDRYTKEVGKLKLSLSECKHQLKNLGVVYEVKRVNQSKKRDREHIQKLLTQLRELKKLAILKKTEEKSTMDSKECRVLKAKFTRTKSDLKKSKSTTKQLDKVKEVIFHFYKIK